MDSASLRQIEIFAQLISFGDTAACASYLDLTEDDVRAAIGGLEDRLGHRLFDSTGQGLALSAAGRRAVEALALLSGDGALTPSSPGEPERAAVRPATPITLTLTVAAPTALFASLTRGTGRVRGRALPNWRSRSILIVRSRRRQRR